MNKWIAIGLLILATIVSWTIAMSVDLDKYELGALINFVYPPIFGVLTILTFLITDWITKKVRIPLTIFLILVNIAFGFYIR
jgi:di/tricarboxylate transporter